jgi:hypothetical protein
VGVKTVVCAGLFLWVVAGMATEVAQRKKWINRLWQVASLCLYKLLEFKPKK